MTNAPERTESQPTVGKCPFSQGQVAPEPSFSVLDAIPGFSRLGRRNETLNGSVQLRGTACQPLAEGNRAGLHYWFSQPLLLSRDPGCPALQMTDELFELVHGNYEARLNDLIARGLLIENGYWHDRLRRGPVVREGDTASIWTGLLVKPAKGLWLLATGPYNRRSELNVREVVIASSEGYTPLVLEIDLQSMFKDTMWLEAEIACLMPLKPDVHFTRASMRERTEVGRAHNEFYSERYFEARGDGKKVGTYRKLLAQSAVAVEEPGAASCELINIAGPDLHTIETFENIVGTSGPMPEEAPRLQFAVLRNSTDLEFDFDGVQAHLNNDDADAGGDELISTWTELYGPEYLYAVDWWAPYFLPNVKELLGEPQFLLTTFVFVTTPPGWSTLSDGTQLPGMDGLRGIVATDLFFHSAPVFRFRRTGDFRIAKGAALSRLLPVPRRLLDTLHRMVELESVLGIDSRD